MKKTGLVFFPAFDWAISPTHPEREERLLYTRDQIFEEGLMDLPQITEYKPRLATKKDVARTHFCVPNVAGQTTEAHLIAAGGALVIADALMKGEIHNGFAMVRPPGHHAMRVVHGNRGFCNINNEAIMVDYLRHKYGIKKVAIIDTDVHHGDGTQDIFYHDPDVLFISFHQDGRTLYPGSGFTNEAGGPAAYGTTLNVPLPPGTTDEGIHYVLDNLILPVLNEFQPEIVINSAGQDNHYTDPLANMKVSAQGYAQLNQKLAPDIAVLEGGYAIETALPYVNTGIILAMAGLDYSHVIEPDYNKNQLVQSPEKTERIKETVEELLAVWKQRNKIELGVLAHKSDFYQRQKTIFYDTDYIHENQVEKVRLCCDCAGYMTIMSQAFHHNGRRSKVFCVTIPFNACQRCYNDAHNDYMNAVRSEAYDYVYLQNKAEDVYRIFTNVGTKKLEEF
ncbi:histone deacetylase family protein [Thermincola potens]|uniref:Histone deacetylase n=1 Tax=Thermincola potens (strain JR) TaxID=635013 RepID=D5XFC3_THEPJ|nr:histone deacetylase [Thermincola potens]ADG82344.1 Histone deacetylase [Thermincola potens JR]